MTRKLNDKIANLFCSDLNSDIKFLIECENIEYPAHKFIISLGSDVLYNMVNGTDAACPTSTIIVTNYSSMAFLPVLKYLYTDNLEWSLDNYEGVLEVGKYFGINELENLFDIYVANTVNCDNALDIYARFFQKQDLISRTSMKIIQLDLSRYLNSDDNMKFFELPSEALSQILRLDELCIRNEEELLQTMMMWSKETELDKKSISSILGKQVKLIRFADIAIQDYGEFEELLRTETNTRWKIEIIESTEISKVGNSEAKKIKLDDEDYEIIRIIAKNKTIRLHGICALSLNAVYVENNTNFETISCCRCKVLDCCGESKYEDHVDVMFENSIEIAKHTTIQLKVPVCSSGRRFLINETELFFVEGVHRGNAVNKLPIAQIFISSR